MATNASTEQFHSLTSNDIDVSVFTPFDQMWSMVGSDVLLFALGLSVYVFLLLSHRAAHWMSKWPGKTPLRKLPSERESRMSCKQVELMPQANDSRRKQADDEKSSIFEQLRSLRKGARQAETSRVLMSAMQNSEVLDESLLTAVVDACIRVDRMDLLGRWIQKQRPAFERIKKEHTFSSVIRAYGALGDPSSAWEIWTQLRKSHRSLACVSVGCMVAAITTNGDPESAYDLIQELRQEEANKHVLNSVTWGTVIKGFSQQKKFDRAWTVFEEMQSAGSDLTIVTFNTIIDACARCEQASRIPELLKGMQSRGIKPDIITYGAALKGFCQDGDIDQAVKLLQEMRDGTEFKLDEMMYNSLLDGCAKRGLWVRACSVLDEMVEAGVAPSTFTLSVLVKVGRRSCCPLGTIFEVVQQLSRDHSIRLNEHVFTNLVHLCVSRKDWNKTLTVFETMLEQGLRPEARTYTVLLKGLVAAGSLQTADGVLRAALGLPGANASFLVAAQEDAGRLCPSTPLPKEVLFEVVDGMICRGRQGRAAASQILADMKSSGKRIDAKIKLRFAATLMEQVDR